MTGTPRQTKTTKPAVRRNGNGNGTSEAGNGQAEMVMAMNGAAIDVFSRACQAYLTGMAEMNSEIAGFWAKRFGHDAQLNASLARCETWEDAATLQQEWAREAAEEYAEEARRLMELASKVSTEQWEPVWTETRRAVDDFTKPAA